MKLVVCGLSVSSSWGNGHATLWRGLCAALGGLGVHVVFFEKDAPYYAAHRDLTRLPVGDLRLYTDINGVDAQLRAEMAGADAIVVTSYCPDAVHAAYLAWSLERPLKVFYDLDTPVTLDALGRGEPVPYLPPEGLGAFDLVLSYTGGSALAALERRLGARRVAPLYGSVDPRVHRPAPRSSRFAADLSYLGTYAADRQDALDRLLVEVAGAEPERRFVVGGAQYPADFPPHQNIALHRHVAPAEHGSFYCSSRLTLNVTRASMARQGYCPSGRLFEAAACGVAIVSDRWDGLAEFFVPDVEILLVDDTVGVRHALERSDAELGRIAAAARDRALEEHTAHHRAAELLRLLDQTRAKGHLVAG
jgi:spore maturation protein CgeB